MDDIFNNIDDQIEEPVQSIESDSDIFLGEPIKQDSLVDEVLKTKGIEDSSKIIILDDDNNEQEVDFYSLSKEEQIEILNSNDLDNDYNLEDNEINAINKLRESGLSFEDYLEQYKTQILADANVESSTQLYEIDAYTDQELFLMDLKNKFENLTDEELEKKLNKELEDEDLFKKQVDQLRTEYKGLEDQYKEEQSHLFEQQQQEQYDQFANTMINVAQNTSELYDFELEDEEKEEVLSFLLNLDESGTSEFSKLLNNPAKLYEAAWFLKYGKEAIDALKSAYESEITKIKKDTTKTKIVVKEQPNKKIDNFDIF